jgi:NAD(P)-dependent dehydrogenase (short-subunit alcohol dehydrogenase family)
MHVLIIGASKGIGLETTRQALAAGHHVRALARSATGMSLSDPSLEKVHGDALKAQDVETALSGVEVVIQTLGVGLGDLFRPVHLILGCDPGTDRGDDGSRRQTPDLFDRFRSRR